MTPVDAVGWFALGAVAYQFGQLTWKLWLAPRWRRWRKTVYWRRTLCPHGHFYTAEAQRRECPRVGTWRPCEHSCHETRYGYGRKVKR